MQAVDESGVNQPEAVVTIEPKSKEGQGSTPEGNVLSTPIPASAGSDGTTIVIVSKRIKKYVLTNKGDEILRLIKNRVINLIWQGYNSTLYTGSH